eukprot:m.203992 g.203992  ORF g.203992 m.203992 type:complete len:980 (+) comp13738_c2_seq1:63-3002(+)
MVYLKPEVALRSARDLQETGKTKLAIEKLRSALTNRRAPWSTATEEVANLHLDLCLQLKEGNFAKDGLHQYRALTYNEPQAFEKAVQYFLDGSKARLEKAWRESRNLSEEDEIDPSTQQVDVGDIEEVETPESVLLAAVSAAGSQDRSDRVMLAPWLRYRWSAFKTALDLLKNQEKFEKAYHRVAAEACNFYIKYGRRMEYRRFCSNMRTHTMQARVKSYRNTIDLEAEGTFLAQINTRLTMVRAAYKLDLWQESFHGMEEINNIIKASTQKPTTKILATYYHRLAKIYWKSQDYIFHAVAWQKLFALILSQPHEFKPEEIRIAASSVLLSTLAVPIARKDTSVKDVDTYPIPGAQAGRIRRLCGLINISTLPNRDELISEMKLMNVMLYVNSELKDLYSVLETEFSPLEMSKKVAPLFKFLGEREHFEKYISAFHYVVIMRLLKQLSQVYTTLRTEKLVKLIPFCSQSEIEKHIINAVKDQALYVRLCHKTKSITFLNPTLKTNGDVGPQLKNLTAEQRTGHLACIARRLRAVSAMVNPAYANAEGNLRLTIATKDIVTRINHEQRRLRQRPKQNEARTEKLERERDEVDQEALEKQRQEEEAEKERIKHEKERAKQKLVETEQKTVASEKDRVLVEERINLYLAKDVGKALFEHLTKSEIAKLKVEDVDKMMVEAMKKEQEKKSAAIRSKETRLDNMERAKREIEIPLLETKFKQEFEKRVKYTQEKHVKDVETGKKRHARALKLREKLRNIVQQKERFVEKLMERRKEEHVQAEKLFKEKRAVYVEYEKQQKELARRKRMEEEERKKKIEEREEEKQKKDEAIRLKKEEQQQKRMDRGAERESPRSKYSAGPQSESESKAKSTYGTPTSRGDGDSAWRRSERKDSPRASSSRGTKYVPPGLRKDEESKPRRSNSDQNGRTAAPSSRLNRTHTAPVTSREGQPRKYVPPGQRQRQQQDDGFTQVRSRGSYQNRGDRS